MIRAEAFTAAAARHGFRLYSGVPCSFLQPLINHTLGAPGIRYVAAANEGQAVAVASGARLGGCRSVVMIQNSGLGNAVSPLTSLNGVFRLPVLLIVTLRADPHGPPDEPQHALMGRITTGLLDLMGVRWNWFPTAEEELDTTLGLVAAAMDEGIPHALVMRSGAVAPHPLSHAPAAPPAAPSRMEGRAGAAAQSRRRVLEAVRAAAGPDTALIATTGYTARELFALGDAENQFYVVGSMGLASSLALGLACARPERRVIVLDGDGAALMHMGALPMIAATAPPNLLHVILDNGVYESTGGQAVPSSAADLAGVAAACGYPRVVRAADAAAVGAVVAGWREELTLVHVRTAPAGVGDLPRPDVTPPDVARRFTTWLERAR